MSQYLQAPKNTSGHRGLIILTQNKHCTLSHSHKVKKKHSLKKAQQSRGQQTLTLAGPELDPETLYCHSVCFSILGALFLSIFCWSVMIDVSVCVPGSFFITALWVGWPGDSGGPFELCPQMAEAGRANGFHPPLASAKKKEIKTKTWRKWARNEILVARWPPGILIECCAP